MSRSFLSASAVVVLGSVALGGSVGQSVLEFDQGTPSGVVAPYTNLAGAVGLPVGNTGFGALTPFNPAFDTSHLLGIGAGGHATIQLSSPIAINGTARLGVFGNTGIIDEDPESDFDVNFNYISGGRGIAGSTPLTFGGGSAIVSVSADNVTYVPLSASATTFNIPSNTFTDNDIALGFGSIGSASADFFKPFEGSLADFAGLRYRDPLGGADILSLLDGSGGGTWLDLSGVALPSVSYVRFDVPTGSRLLIDAVTAIPEPASISILLMGSMLLRRRR